MPYILKKHCAILVQNSTMIHDVRFAYCIELNIEEDGSVKFIMPSVLGERYGSGGTPTADLAAAGVQLLLPPLLFHNFPPTRCQVH